MKRLYTFLFTVLAISASLLFLPLNAIADNDVIQEGENPETEIEDDGNNEEDPGSSDLIAELCKLGLNVVEVITVDGEEPTCDYVSPDPELGATGLGIANATKVPSEVNIYLPDGSLAYRSGPYVKSTSGATIKIRGNTSAYPEKKPYKIKLQKKADLLLRGDKNLVDKNWALLNDGEFRNMEGYEMNHIVGLPWSPSAQNVNVVINGEYRGIYLLVETVERNAKARLNVDEDTGFIAELDAYWWNEDGYFPSIHAPMFNYTLKYPDYEDLTEEQTAYIDQYMQAFDNSKIDGTFDKTIDVTSVARWLLGHDLLGTSDSAGANMYFMKYDNSEETLLQMANMWDLDTSYGTPGQWSPLHTIRFRHFFQGNNKSMIKEYVRLWKEISPTYLSKVLGWWSAFLASEEGIGVTNSVPLNNQRWNSIGPSPSEAFHNVLQWHIDRKEWMDGMVAQMEETLVDPLSTEGIASLGLPVLDILTVSGELPTYTTLMQPEVTEGEGLAAIDTRTVVDGTVEIIDPLQRLKLDDPENGTIHLSVYGKKVPPTDEMAYNLYIDGMQTRKWVLRKDNELKERIAYKLNEETGLKNNPETIEVNVILNGEYKGVYLLCSVPEDLESSVVTLDPYWWSGDDYYFESSQFGPEFNWTYTRTDETGDEASNIDVIADRFSEFEANLANMDFANIDMQSMQSFLIIHDLMNTYDAKEPVTRFLVNDEGEVRVESITNATASMSPAAARANVIADGITSEIMDDDTDTTDEDVSGADEYDKVFSDIHKRLFRRLMSHPDPVFYNSYLDAWQKDGKRLLAGINNYLLSLIADESRESHDNSVSLYNTTYGAKEFTRYEAVSRAMSFFEERRGEIARALSAMDPRSAINLIEDDHAGMLYVIVDGRTITVTGNDDSCTIEIYNAQGAEVYRGNERRIELGESGLYIVRCGNSVSKVMLK